MPVRETGWYLVEPSGALILVVVLLIVFVIAFYALLARRGFSLLSPPVRKVILEWPRSDIVRHHEMRGGYLMEHTVPDVAPRGAVLYREGREGGVAIHRDGIHAYFATVAVEDVTDWSAFLDGYRAVANLSHQFVP